MINFIEKNIGLLGIVAICLSAGTWFNFINHKSESSTPATTINAPKVTLKVEGSPPVSSFSSPLDVDEPSPVKQTEEEIMASIVRNACLRRCPSGSVPVYIGDKVTGFFNHETAHLTNFSEGERLNL